MLAPLQTSLFASGSTRLSDASCIRRTWLDDACWIDHATGWVEGADSLLVDLIEVMAFTQGKRLMWDNWVVEPRLTSVMQLDDRLLPQVVGEMAASLGRLYHQSFDQLFTNYYRSGADSVAWHSDRIGRQQVNPLVAIVSLGGPRTLQLRPMERSLGGADIGMGRVNSARFVLQSGDLLVMGGATQHCWQHSIAKVRQASPRISLTMRAHHSTPS